MSEDKREFVHINAGDIETALTSAGQVAIILGYARLPRGKDRFKLTLTMEAAQMEVFAKTLLQLVEEAKSSTAKH